MTQICLLRKQNTQTIGIQTVQININTYWIKKKLVWDLIDPVAQIALPSTIPFEDDKGINVRPAASASDNRIAADNRQMLRNETT